MELLLGSLGIAAAVVCFISSIWLLAIAFRTNIWWGLAYMFIPLASLAFVALHWNKVKKPFLCLVAGIIVVISVALMVPSMLTHMLEVPKTNSGQTKT
jgi:hypothetical protein